MEQRNLGKTGPKIAPLVLGGNVFGWTVDEKTSFEILDAFTDGGLTADVYSAWVPGNRGGESETILGKWFQKNPANRKKVVLITKVGSEMGPGEKGLSARWITRAVEDSLERLGTDHIDLYLSHRPDPEVPLAETLEAYDQLLKAGKILAVGASNYSADQLKEALNIAQAKGLPRYGVLQPEYNLYSRNTFDGALRDLTMAEEIGVIPYYSLASGFLTGKYRSEKDLGKSPRGQGIAKYLNPRGFRILDALDHVAAGLGARPSEVALAWLIARPGVTAPIASATSRTQVENLVKAARLTLGPAEVKRLDDASAE